MLRLPVKGDGYWTETPTIVVVTGLELKRKSVFEGELKVFLDRKTWAKKPALIASDDLFLTSLQKYLERHQYAADDIFYGDDHGEDHISVAVGPKFLESWLVQQRGY